MGLAMTFTLIGLIALGIYIYTFTESGKRWTGEIDDAE
ncbi:hypothetical protein Barb6_02379 [Bacteroidales bacterium Barb6]|nr:hypothetical protein Barb6XT_02311 [Bacteroidales bacterium Barb6XT]OAV67271.1 hypothetical protein Barb6_02379 [Bacteroidales bacterium Barb6]